jgi:hypothetical protein
MHGCEEGSCEENMMLEDYMEVLFGGKPQYRNDEC